MQHLYNELQSLKAQRAELTQKMAGTTDRAEFGLLLEEREAVDARIDALTKQIKAC